MELSETHLDISHYGHVSVQKIAATWRALEVSLHSIAPRCKTAVSGQRHVFAACPWVRAPVINVQAAGWVPRAGLENKIICCPPGMRTPKRPVSSNSLYPCLSTPTATLSHTLSLVYAEFQYTDKCCILTYVKYRACAGAWGSVVVKALRY